MLQMPSYIENIHNKNYSIGIFNNNQLSNIYIYASEL